MNRRTWLQRAAALLSAAFLPWQSRGEVMDCRDPAKTPRRSLYSFDAATGEAVPKVFYYDPNTNLVGRFALNADGRFYFDPATDDVARFWEYRKLRFVDAGPRQIV